MADTTPELPDFEEGKTYVLSGKTLNQIIAAIRQATILSVDGGEIERTPEGVRIKIK